MKLTLLSEEDMQALKDNTEAFLPHFNQPYDGFIHQYLGKDPVFLTFNKEVEEFSLLIEGGTGAQLDASNVKLLYDHLKFLTPSQASDERLWSGLCLGIFWDYMQKRWSVSTVRNIKERYFFNHGSSAKRSVMRNGLARLWWVGHIVYDEKREDPYELMEPWSDGLDALCGICESNQADNEHLVKPFLGAILDGQKAGIPMTRELVRDLIVYLNLLGGTMLLDCLSYEDIYKKTEARMNKFTK